MTKEHCPCVNFLCSPTCVYNENDDIEGKRKIGQLIAPISFSPSFLIGKLKVESVGRKCAYQEVK